jgi:hypothetical protein
MDSEGAAKGQGKMQQRSALKSYETPNFKPSKELTNKQKLEARIQEISKKVNETKQRVSIILLTFTATGWTAQSPRGQHPEGP